MNMLTGCGPIGLLADFHLPENVICSVSDGTSWWVPQFITGVRVIGRFVAKEFEVTFWFIGCALAPHYIYQKCASSMTMNTQSTHNDDFRILDRLIFIILTSSHLLKFWINYCFLVKLNTSPLSSTLLNFYKTTKGSTRSHRWIDFVVREISS